MPLVLVAGPSQAGKSTLISKYLEEHANSVRVPTATTRPKRPEEVEGKDKFFVDKAYFENNKQDFLEQVEEHGNYYGIIKSKLLECIQNYAYSFMDLDYRGVQSITQADLGVEIITLFVTPDTIEEVYERIERKNDSNKEQRKTSAQKEFFYRQDPLFQHIINTSCSKEESYAAFKALLP